MIDLFILFSPIQIIQFTFNHKSKIVRQVTSAAKDKKKKEKAELPRLL